MTCAHSSPSEHATVIKCSNSEVPGNGSVPADFCNICPWHTDVVKNVKPTNDPKPPCSTCPDNYTTTVLAKDGDNYTVTATRTRTIRKDPYTSGSSTVNPIKQPVDRDWAVVVTTAPRKSPTLTDCIQSLFNAGWNPVIFAEPDSIQLEDVKTFTNSTKLGAWHNWLKSVKWALKYTEARYIMTVQDDSLFHPDSRSFIESVMWPDNNIGFLSLYTASHYSFEKDNSPKPLGINRIRTGSLWGACALVFPRHVLQDLINHPVALNWTGIAPAGLNDAEREHTRLSKLENPHLIQNVDSAIGRILNAMHLGMYFVNPSPVQHIATHSAISHGSNTGKRNCGRCADHSIPLEEQVFPYKPPLHKVVGFSKRMLSIVEEEIGYAITCETCLAFISSLDKEDIYSLPKLVLELYTQLQLPDKWRKKYIGRSIRLARIEELIKPLFIGD